MVLVGLEFTEFEGGHFTCARVFENSGDRLIVGGGYALWRGEVMPKATGRVLLVGEPDFLKVQ
ncbi:hypothetical protein D9R14_07450 [Xanthobacter tagetidis]|uniref:Uncharacterized protein n=2 Tax=Xanthobacter tagetidis TaxID=60216 RepID=A0A3L7AIS9_9HYPH|nr:hypothetical protein D9R14_07450 [Xanthobacter tagetidis]